jgi:hypothetical protein
MMQFRRLTQPMFCRICLVALLASGSSSVAQSTPSSSMSDLIVSLLKRNAQLELIEVSFTLDIGVLAGKPARTTSGVYLKSGSNEHLTKRALELPDELHWSDGKITRHFTDSFGGASPSGTIAHADETLIGSFGRKGEEPRGFTGEFIWGQELIPALEGNKVELNPQLVEENGIKTIELHGKMKSKEVDGMDSLFFRALLDPAHSFMPRRIEQNQYDSKNELTMKIVFDQYTYSEISPGLWYPTGLRQQAMKKTSGGEWEIITTNYMRAEVKSVNQAIPASRFIFLFPQGTDVTDLVNATSFEKALEYKVGELPFNDNIFDRVASDISRAHAVGPATSSGQAPELWGSLAQNNQLYNRANLVKWIIGAIFAIVAGLLSYFLVKHQRRQKAS